MSLLRSDLAQKFIDITAKDIKYNINIMDENGIIIASKDSSRIGQFHEVAHGILNGILDTGVVRENEKYIGTKPGVNMLIEYKNKPVGVICVTGDPDIVGTFATLAKRSMEAMLEYEMQMEYDRHRRSKRDQLLYYLLFNENININVATALADTVGIDTELLRVCMLITYDSGYNPHNIMEALTSAEGHSNQDIITFDKNQDIIMYKALAGDSPQAIRDYRYIIQDYINDFYKMLPEHYSKEKIGVFVGTIQKDIDRYRFSYRHAQDIELQKKGENGLFFFHDNILDYYRNLVTIKTYDIIFSVYSDLFDKEEQQQIAETVDVLVKNNYNVASSAKALYIHRNTLLARLNKIKDILDIDPTSDYKDREFLNELAYYFRNKK